jgi:hypothetical protein
VHPFGLRAVRFARRVCAWHGGCVTDEPGLGQQLESFREVRRKAEASVLPLATSVDGRRFSFQASLYGLELQAGGYVVLEGDGGVRLGQVLTLELGRQLGTELSLPADGGGTPAARTQVEIRYARGEGALLEGESASFHDALVRPATAEEVRAWLRRSARPDAKLRLGELALVGGVPCLAEASGFDRHTFLCGQSGSSHRV